MGTIEERIEETRRQIREIEEIQGLKGLCRSCVDESTDSARHNHRKKYFKKICELYIGEKISPDLFAALVKKEDDCYYGRKQEQKPKNFTSLNKSNEYPLS